MNKVIFGKWLTIFIILSSNQIHLTEAAIGDICTHDNNCTSTLANTECTRMYDCETGTCVCQSGYGNSNGNGCQNILSGFNEPCGSGYYCNGANQECSSTTGRCACTYWYSYSYLAGECTLRTYKILTEPCGGWYNLQCIPVLLDTNGGGECLGTCRCRAGYQLQLTQSYITCRAPKWGESCEWLPKCEISFNTSTVSDDDSSTPPTCTNGICTCPPSHEHQVVDGYDLCLNNVADGFERYDVGENCTDFSECQSRLCVKCPGAVSGVCMAVPETNVTDSIDSGAVSNRFASPYVLMTGILLTSIVAALLSEKHSK